VVARWLRALLPSREERRRRAREAFSRRRQGEAAVRAGYSEEAALGDARPRSQADHNDFNSLT
jgi:hypothetical protein